MELKYRFTTKESKEHECFNCTFMELKFCARPGASMLARSFNCTFMELKLCGCGNLKAWMVVLIVPLWN